MDWKKARELLEALVALNCDEDYKSAIAAALAEVDRLTAAHPETILDRMDAVNAKIGEMLAAEARIAALEA